MKRVFFTGLAASILVLAMPPQALARTCSSNDLVGRATQATPFAILNQRAAMLAAKKDWVDDCLKAFGDPWCEYRLARRKQEHCTRVPNGLGGYNHDCVIKARPCRP